MATKKRAATRDHVRRVRIFISSPGDVPEERARAAAVVQKLGKDDRFRDRLSLDAFLWDDPEAPAAMLANLPPQESVNDRLRPSVCDIVVVIFWSRMGTPLDQPLKGDGSPYLSGTEWELEDALRGVDGRPKPKVVVYRASRDLLISARDPEFAAKLRQQELVDQFFAGFKGSVTAYGTPDEFGSRLENDLRQIVPAFLDDRPTPTRKSRAARATRPAASPLVVPPAYREWLKKETRDVELLGLQSAEGRSLFLNAVYVPVVTNADEIDHPAFADLRRPDERPHLLLHALGSRSLFVPGGPGSGKSTFCRWVAWLTCEGAVPPPDVVPPDDYAETLPASLEGRLAVLLPLRQVWDRLTADDRIESACAQWLQEESNSAIDAQTVASFLAGGRALLLLDGVDEVPTIDAGRPDVNPREVLIARLKRAIAQWISVGNIVLVTSRPFALADREVRSLRLAVAPIADLDDELQNLLARRWFRIQRQDAVKGDARASELILDITSRAGWLQPLAANPLMLSAMCAIYSNEGELPRDRHELYERILESVLIKRYRDVDLRSRVRFDLSAIAYAMHTGDAFGAPRVDPLARATFDEAETALRNDNAVGSLKQRVLGPRATVADLVSRSGLLTGTGDQRTFSFFHFSIQEFLAAQRIYDSVDLTEAFLARSPIATWRLTLGFLFGRYVAGFMVPARAHALWCELVDRLPDDSFPMECVAADCAEALAARSYVRDEARLQRLRERLLRSMTTRADGRERCEAGNLLGRLGDPRFRRDAWHLPDEPTLGFIHVPAGRFLMGSNEDDDGARPEEMPQHAVDLGEYWLARLPVTVAQFRVFVEDTGTTPSAPECLRGGANRPVLLVTFREAVRYCDWLTEKLRRWTAAPAPVASWLESTLLAGWDVSLPSEAEWERAARGTDRRTYSWGDTYDQPRANTEEAGILEASPVGAFPLDVSPIGALDMTGNVAEWTRSLFTPYPYDPHDRQREDLNADDETARVGRGGSFMLSKEYSGNATRDWLSADVPNFAFGFRLAVIRQRR